MLEKRQKEATLREFLEEHFAAGEIKPKTAEYYEYGRQKLLTSELAKMPLKKISNQDVQRYIARHVRPAKDFQPAERKKHLEIGRYSPSSVNCVLRTLRRALFLAHEAQIIERPPVIKWPRTNRTGSPTQTGLYREKCAQPCSDVSVLCLNSGMRPSEIYSMRWENLKLNPVRLSDDGGNKYGLIDVPDGKTKAATRDLDLTAESYEVLKRRHEQQGRPKKGWVFPAPTKLGHINESSIKKQHAKAIKESGLEYFEFYCFRHTFLTILGGSGCDPYTFCKIAGHSDIQMGMRYCHPQEEMVSRAFSKLGEFRQIVVTKGGYHENYPSTNPPVSLEATASKGKP